MTRHDQLVHLLATKSAQHGQFTLASGVQSSLYIDARMTTMSPEGLAIIGPLGLEALWQSHWNPNSIGGLTLGADPISYAIAYASASADLPLRAFTVRKQAKTYGTNKQIEGPFNSGDRVAIVEDVITTGRSALQAIDAVVTAGATVIGVIALVDREEGGRLQIERAGYHVITLVTATEIVAQMV
jgi:orotate phosphoribosyltransferase